MKTLNYTEIAEQLNSLNLDYAFEFDVNEYISVEGLFNFAHEECDFDGVFTEKNISYYVECMMEMV